MKQTGPRRTCVGCRQTAAKADLRRVVFAQGGPVFDARALAPGRGAYVHASRSCLERALSHGGLARALAQPISAQASRSLLDAAQSLHMAGNWLVESR